MEITYNIKAVYIYHDEGKTKVHSFSGKVNRSVWEYALSTPDFRSFLEAKSRECFDTISRMNQTLRDVVVVFHISFQDNIPFVRTGMAVITVLILLTACLTDINRRRITRRMEIQDKKTGNH